MLANVADSDDDDENYLFSIDLECDDTEVISVNKNSEQNSCKQKCCELNKHNQGIKTPNTNKGQD